MQVPNQPMRLLALWAICFSFLFPSFGADTDVLVRVIDVGAGLCCVVKMPQDHFMIYDAGDGSKANDKITEVIPKNSVIDLMVLSHSDSDHLGSVPFICKNYKVKRIIYSGLMKPVKSNPTTPTLAWANAVRAIKKESTTDGCDAISLATRKLVPGTTHTFGEVKVMMVFGLSKPPPEWGFSTTTHEAEFYNAGSIVVRLEFKNRSILFAGDSIGRLGGHATSECIAAEHAMVTNAPHVTIASDVLIAPHHGADNASSQDFIQAVHPKTVIFSAGTLFRHPRTVTVQRFLSIGLSATNLFRTDLGDKKRAEEWDFKAGSGDKAGDDDIDITIQSNGKLKVAYRNN